MILITGATSGFGEACARKLIARGETVWAIGRREDRLGRLCAKFTSVLDVSDPVAVDAWAKANAKRLADVTVLVNNAGLARGTAKFQESDPRDWDEMIDTNVKGLLRMTKAVLPSMISAGRGQIVNIGSVAGRWAYPGGNVYCATKAAVSLFTEALRHDLHGTGIRVTEIKPGMADTEFSLVRTRDAAKAKAVYAGMTPLSADDVADAILWAIDRPKHVNIQEIVLYPTDQATVGVVHRRPEASR
jgi:NADP-dependent 3-hydroxy acid dehydrogenase YdfG